MSKDNKKSRVGFGMKPRGAQEIPADAIEKPIEEQESLSAEEGQPKASLDPVPETVERVEDQAEGGSTLEVQNLDSVGTASVPPDERVVIGLSQGYTPESTVEEVFGGPVTVKAPDFVYGESTEEARAALDAVLKQEADVESKLEALIAKAREYEAEPHVPTAEETDKSVAEGQIIVVGEEEAKGILAGLGGVDQQLAAGAIMADPNYKRHRLGQRDDGTYGLVVTIPEGYIEAIKDQAQSDDMSPEDWVSLRLAEVFENWWYPAKGK